MSDLVDLLDDPDAIVGASGAGKSYTGRHKVEQLLELHRHTIIFDPTGVWYGLRSNAAGTGPGFDIPIFGGPHGDVPIRPENGAAIANILIGDRVSAIIDLSQFEEEGLRQFALDFLDRLRDRERVNLHLVFDEAEEFAPQTAPDDVGFRLVRRMTWIAKRGRVFGLVPTFLIQRPADFAKAVLSQVQTLYFHQLIAPADQKPVLDYVKANADKGTLQLVQSTLPELERGQRWVYSPRRKLLDRGFTPPIKTFDSMATPAPGEAKAEPRTLAQLDVSKIRDALAEAGSPPPIVDEAERASPPPSWPDQREEVQRLLQANAALRDQVERMGRRLSRIATLAMGGVTAEDGAGGLPTQETQAKAGADAALPESGVAEPVSRRAGARSPEASAGVAISADAPTVRGRKALLALQLNPGLTERQWAWVAGFSIKGGTWGTYKSSLRAAALVEERDGKWWPTETGFNEVVDAAGTFPPLGRDLALFWGGKIPGVRRMVDALLDSYPDWTLRSNLADRLNMAADGGTFGTYLSRLRGAGLIEEQGKKLRLNPELMEPAQ
ncbi:MAG: hypothetical protein ACM3ZV_07565 [Bacillota bacterium]